MSYTKEKIQELEDVRKNWATLSIDEKNQYVFEIQDYLWFILPEEEKQKHLKERAEKDEKDKDNPFVLRRIKPNESQQ